MLYIDVRITDNITTETMKRFKTNQDVIADITASDSSMKRVKGNVVTVKNGFVTIQTNEVMNRWSNEFKNHSMSINVQIENVEAV